jgi:hypothetical protein
MQRSPIRRGPSPRGTLAQISPYRRQQQQQQQQSYEPIIARIAAGALVDYMSRLGRNGSDEATTPQWALPQDNNSSSSGAGSPDSGECDAIYEALDLSGAITATLSATERQSLWSQATFLRQAGEILGRFVFYDASGRALGGPGDPDVASAQFVPAYESDSVVERLLARRPDMFVGVSPMDLRAHALAWASRLWRCIATAATRQPSDAYRDALVAALGQTTERQSALNRRIVDVGRVRLLTSANEGLFLQRPPSPRVAAGPDAPPLQYYRQEINGDGACFYRSIASALMQRLTGINLGRGATFSRSVQSGASDAWVTEDYSVVVRVGAPAVDALALLLNALTKWVKFYVYLVMCSQDIPPGSVTYASGVVGVARIQSMTSIDQIMAPDSVQRIMGQRSAAAGGGDDGPQVVYEPPTLDLVTRYVVWLYEALANSMVDGRQTLSWAQVRPYALPLLSVPWDAAGPQTRLPVDKSVVFYDCQEGQATAVDLAHMLQDSSPEYVAALAAGGNVDVAYRAYCDAMRQSVRWGGAAEAYAFASVLLPDAGSPALGSLRGVIVFNYTDPSQVTALVPQAVPSRPAIDPATGLAVQRDYRSDCLAVLYVGSHYVALHGVQQAADGQIAPFIPLLGPNAVEAFITADGTQQAPAARIVPRSSPVSAASPLARVVLTSPRAVLGPSPLLSPRSSTSQSGSTLSPKSAYGSYPSALVRTVLPRTERAIAVRGPPSTRISPTSAPLSRSRITTLDDTRRRQVQQAANLLTALAEDIVAESGLPIDLLRDSAELRQQLRAVGQASDLPLDALDSVWAAFTRGAG